MKLPLMSMRLGSKDVQDMLWGALLKLEVSEGGRCLELDTWSWCLEGFAQGQWPLVSVHAAKYTCNVNRSGKYPVLMG